MKRNYLIFTLLSALVISGCKNDDTSSSNNASNSGSNSTSSSITGTNQGEAPTVKEAVSHISKSYSIYYSMYDSYNNKHEFKNAVETSKRSGAEGDIAYYSDFNGYGYYVEKESSKGYTIYNNGKGNPIYTARCELSAEYIAVFNQLIDLNGNFSNAEWTYDTFENDVYTYYTDDTAVIATASFLTDHIDKENPVAMVKANIAKNKKISGFKTYNADGDVLIEAEIKRVNGSIAINATPELVADDYVDPAFNTKWMATSNTSHIGYLGAFEVTSDKKINIYSFDQTTYMYEKLDETYSFSYTNEMGYYIFTNPTSQNQMWLKISTGYVSFLTFDVASQTIGEDVALEYYTVWYQMAVDACGFYMEEITSGDVNYEIVTASGASKGYYLYSNVIDEETGEEYTDKMLVMLQYLNKEEAVEKSFGGDTTTYNGFALAGYAYGNIVLGGYFSAESISLVVQISQYLQLEFADFDMSQYPVAEAGQSALDYVISYMTSEGYSYVNKETADPDFVVNAEQAVDEETGEPLFDENGAPVMEGVNFYDEINDYIGFYSDVKYNQEGDTFSAVEMYVFYKDSETQAFDKETGEPLFDENGDPVMESFVEYTGFLVCDMDMTGFVGGYDTVFNCGIGYFSSTGKLLEACMTWFETKTA